MGPLTVEEYSEFFDLAKSLSLLEETQKALLQKRLPYKSLLTIGQYYSTIDPVMAVNFLEKAFTPVNRYLLDSVYTAAIDLLVKVLEKYTDEDRHNKLLFIRKYLSTEELVYLSKFYLNEPHFAIYLAMEVLNSTNKTAANWYCSTFVPYMNDQEINDLIQSKINDYNFIIVAQSLYEYVGEEVALTLVKKKIARSRFLSDANALWIAHAFNYLPSQEWKDIVVSLKPLLEPNSLYDISE